MKVIIHCSDSAFGNAALIGRWHSLPKPHGRGWSGIGYQLVILNGWLSSTCFNKYFDGHMESGRPLNDDALLTPNEFGAHTLGLNNEAVGICLVGKSGEFSAAQYSRLLNVALPLLKEMFGSLEISQHSNHDSKKPHCAGLSQSYIDELNDLFN